jgi:hypothetical protein
MAETSRGPDEPEEPEEPEEPDEPEEPEEPEPDEPDELEPPDDGPALDAEAEEGVEPLLVQAT